MSTFLIIVVGILAIVALAQAVRVFELSSILKGDDPEVTDKDNNTQGLLLLLALIFLFGGFLWMVLKYGDVILAAPASEHGVNYDNLWWISMILIIVVFVITQPLLFGFSYMFRGNKKRKAVYMEHNNRLELFWTAVPAVVLAGLILYGLSTWINITSPSDEEEPMIVELVAQQFSWTARYSGGDNTLGYANVRLIEGANTIGVDPDDENSLDDKVIPVKEIHLPVGKPVRFKFRSLDVIHSAYMPHFRAQMNCVPGASTQFQFTPTVTTAEMRQNPDIVDKVERINEIRSEAGNDQWEFDYILLCNKICGSAHYNMQMKIVVETEEEFNAWMKEQKSFAEML